MTPVKIATPFSRLHAASLLSHRTRIAKFKQAIEQVVNTDSIVLDIGTGTGVLAILAAKQGARRVIAIDIDDGCIQYARLAARANGVDDRIEFFQTHFEEYVPDSKIDIVLCEMLSSMLLVEQQVPAANHAREKVLDENGIFIPQSATVYVVPVECNQLWNRFFLEELVFPPVPQTVDVASSRDLADAAILERFDFADLNISEMIDKVLTFKIVDEGVLHGLVGFFESQLYGDITLQMEDGWRPLFLPLVAPIQVHENDSISVHIRYDPGNLDSLQLELQ